MSSILTSPPPAFASRFATSRRNSRRLATAAVSGGERPSQSSTGPGLAKQQSSGRLVEARAFFQKNPEPASLGPPLSGFAGENFDRWLNIGVLGAVAGVAVFAALHAHPNPWEAYQEAVAANPIETKAVISGAVYSLGDLIAQTYEGRDISEWDRGRIVRSGLCGLLAHGPLSHLYYVALDHGFAQQTLIPHDSWLAPLAKVGIDQTAWSIFWNSTYYVLLGVLKMESPSVIATTVKSTWWDLLKAGWRLWPMVHLFTYGVIPVQHRLLFVDAVELVWVSILSVYGQQQRDKMDAAAGENGAPTWVACALPGADGEGGDPVEEIIRGIEVQNQIVFESSTGERVTMTPADVYAAAPVPVGEAAAKRERS